MASDARAQEEIDRDLGLGTRIAQQGGPRFLNRDGSFNVVREGLGPLRSLSLYHHLLTVSWTKFFGLIVVVYVTTNLVFAAGYLLCGPGALRGASATTAVERFAEAFFFSVQTLATIGYGGVSPSGLAANLLVTVEALVGLLGFALATGLLFSRISRPTARIVFSDRAVIAPYRGITGFMFRIANERSSQLIEVAATVTLSRWETIGGLRLRKFHELALERRRVVFFPLQWVIVHPIDEQSPLRGATQAEFEASDPEVFILLTAVDETFSQTVHARCSYKHHEVVFGARFADMFLRTDDGRAGIDMRRIHEIERVGS